MSEPTTKRSPRRRLVRTVLIATVAMSLVLCALYWFSRTRGDPRFVGTWSVEIIGLDSPRSELEFDSNGSGVATPVAGSMFSPIVPFYWQIDDSRLSLTYSLPVRQRIGVALDVLFGGQSMPGPDAEFDVVAVSTTDIELDAVAPDGTRVRWHLMRVE